MERRQNYLELIAVIRHVLLGEPLPAQLHWEEIVRSAVYHGLIGFVYRAVVGNEDVPNALREQIESAYFMAVGGQVRQDHFNETLFQELTERGIPYMPLRGYCLRALYPQANWRIAQNLDLLVEEASLPAVEEILAGLGFHHTATESAEVYELDRVSIRIQTTLATEDLPAPAGGTYRDTIVTEDGTAYRFTPVAQYVALFAHLRRSFAAGAGIGIRSVLDAYMCRASLSEPELLAAHEWFAERGMTPFVQAIESLASAWFGAGENSNDLMLLGSYIAADGAVSAATEEAALKQRPLRRLFPRYGAMKRRYPVLRYLPFLLPFFWIGRLLVLPFSAKTAESVSATAERQERMLARVREITGIAPAEPVSAEAEVTSHKTSAQ